MFSPLMCAINNLFSSPGRSQSTNTPSASLVTLPVELLIAIVEFTAPQPRNLGARRNRRGQAALARTCRYLHSVANPILYRGNLTRDADDVSCVAWAALYNKTETLKAALRYGADFNKYLSNLVRRRPRVEYPGFIPHYRRPAPCRHETATPLQVALANGSREAVEFLLRNGSDPHITSRNLCACKEIEYDPCALHIAIFESPIEDAVDLLVKLGNAVWERPGVSVLPRLVAEGRHDLVQHLLDLPSDDAATAALRHAVDTGDKTLFMTAITRPGTDINHLDDKLKSVLYRAIEIGETEFAEILLGKPSIQPSVDTARVAAQTGDLHVLKLLFKFPEISLETIGQCNTSLLYEAALNGRLNIVEFLVDTFDVDVTELDEIGQTPLHAAVEGENIGIVKLLLNHPRVDAGIICHYDTTPLVVAIQSKQLPVVELLLEREDVSPTAGFGSEEIWIEIGPLNLASLHGEVEILKKLIAHTSVNLNARDAHGKAALHYAAMGAAAGLIKTDDIFHFLLAHSGVSATDEDASGFNVLHFLSATSCDHQVTDNPLVRDLMDMFISKGVPVNKTSPLGTPFCIAVRTAMGDLRNAAHLLSCGADLTTISRDLDGASPLHHCLSYKARADLADEQAKVMCALIEAGFKLEAHFARNLLSRQRFIPEWGLAELVFDVHGTPLCLAAVYAESVECTTLLLEAGASVDCSVLVRCDLFERHPITPMGVAGNGVIQVSILAALIRTDNILGKDNRISVHGDGILEDSLKERITILLLYGAKIDAEVEKCLTPLWVAAELALGGKFEILNCLLENSTRSNCRKFSVVSLIGQVSVLQRTSHRDAVLGKLLDHVREKWAGLRMWEQRKGVRCDGGGY